MAALFTIDASVFVAACRPDESGCTDCRELLRWVRQTSVPLIEPTILPVEIAAALARVGETAKSASGYAEGVAALPDLTMIALDERFARRAIVTATKHRLRAADALYVTVAVQYGARLVTLDNEQLKRAPASVRVCKPDAATALLRPA